MSTDIDLCDRFTCIISERVFGSLYSRANKRLSRSVSLPRPQQCVCVCVCGHSADHRRLLRQYHTRAWCSSWKKNLSFVFHKKKKKKRSPREKSIIRLRIRCVAHTPASGRCTYYVLLKIKCVYYVSAARAKRRASILFSDFEKKIKRDDIDSCSISTRNIVFALMHACASVGVPEQNRV